MKFYLLFIFISLNLCSFSARATDTIFVYETQVPILIERQDNMLFLMRLTTARSDTKLNEVVLRLGQNVNLSNINLSSCIMEVRKHVRTMVRSFIFLLPTFLVMCQGRHWLRILLIRLINHR